MDDPADVIFKKKSSESQSGIHMTYLGSIAFFFGVSVLAMVIDFSNFTIHMIGLTYFIDIPSFVMVLPTAVFFGIAVTSIHACKLGCLMTLGCSVDVPREKAKEASRFLRVTGRSSLLLGLYGTLMGAILLGHQLENLSDLGPALAVAFVTTFYGIGFQLVFYVADQRLKNKYLSEPTKQFIQR